MNQQQRKAVVDHINAVGPVTERSLVNWITDQLVDAKADAARLLFSLHRNEDVYSYVEDGVTYVTTKEQDPR